MGMEGVLPKKEKGTTEVKGGGSCGKDSEGVAFIHKC
jgi:hypothetical protein